MRKLNDSEIGQLSSLKEKHKAVKLRPSKTTVHYEYEGNKTIAVISCGGDKNLIGIARYNPKDKELGLPYRKDLGQRIAFGRAVANGNGSKYKDFQKQVEKARRFVERENSRYGVQGLKHLVDTRNWGENLK